MCLETDIENESNAYKHLNNDLKLMCLKWVVIISIIKDRNNALELEHRYKSFYLFITHRKSLQ